MYFPVKGKMDQTKNLENRKHPESDFFRLSLVSRYIFGPYCEESLLSWSEYLSAPMVFQVRCSGHLLRPWAELSVSIVD